MVRLDPARNSRRSKKITTLPKPCGVRCVTSLSVPNCQEEDDERKKSTWQSKARAWRPDDFQDTSDRPTDIQSPALLRHRTILRVTHRFFLSLDCHGNEGRGCKTRSIAACPFFGADREMPTSLEYRRQAFVSAALDQQGPVCPSTGRFQAARRHPARNPLTRRGENGASRSSPAHSDFQSLRN